jgi:hypothetical protein
MWSQPQPSSAAICSGSTFCCTAGTPGLFLSHCAVLASLGCCIVVAAPYAVLLLHRHHSHAEDPPLATDCERSIKIGIRIVLDPI